MLVHILIIPHPPRTTIYVLYLPERENGWFWQSWVYYNAVHTYNCIHNQYCILLYMLFNFFLCTAVYCMSFTRRSYPSSFPLLPMNGVYQCYSSTANIKISKFKKKTNCHLHSISLKEPARAGGQRQLSYTQWWSSYFYKVAALLVKETSYF
jgi:hypothetical protein